MALNKKKELVKALSELKEAEYSKDPELNHIYQRLENGRKQLGDVLENNIKAVMQISSLDLTMQHQTEKIDDISRNVTKVTEELFGTNINDSVTAGRSNNQHEHLTSSIIDVSSATDEVYKKIEAGQNELTSIKELSAETIEVSIELRQNMDELLKKIEQISNVISGIDSISLQTNLLALNASIEASRAGTAGKGFAVVAEEIRSLAAETQKLTGNMSSFVEDIKSASQKSTQSAESTISALETMTDKIKNVWELNDISQQHVSQVNSSISSIAAVSEELSSSMTEMENQLIDSTSFMNQVSQDLKEAVKPVVEIEHTLDSTVKQLGDMTKDAFYHLENQEFAKYITNAISAHHAWLTNLKKMVANRTITPLQLDSSKCGFGHFYYAMTPRSAEVLPTWIALEAKHKRFHQFGAEVMEALKRESYFEAEQICRNAEEYSKTLISDLEHIKSISNG